jgi:hypothetical protein
MCILETASAEQTTQQQKEHLRRFWYASGKIDQT